MVEAKVTGGRRGARRIAVWGALVLVALWVGGVGAGCFPLGVVDDPASTWAGKDRSPFVTGPYLIRTRPTEVVVALKARLDRAPMVEWWRVQRNEDRTRAPARGVHRVRAERAFERWIGVLSGTPSGEPLAYQVVSGRGNAGPFLFKAGEVRGKPFRFGAFGDTRTGHEVHRAVIEGLARERVDFVIHTGDMVETGGLVEQWDLFFQIERPLLAKAPVFPAIGNHDISSRDHYGHSFLMTLWTDDMTYYHQDWGDLRVVTIDTGIECRTGCTQNAYARAALADGARKNMLMVVSLHHPPYSSGPHGSSLGVREAIEPLAIKYGVELVFAGHDHHYERSKVIGGVTYVVSGSAGAPIRPVRRQPHTEVVRTEPHYVLVDVEGDRMTLRAVNLQGQTFDTAVIRANPPGPHG